MKNVFLNPKIEIEEKLEYLGHYLGQSLKDSTDIAHAENLFRQLLEENPQEPDLHTMYGGLLLSQGKEAAAKAEFEVVVELAPDKKEIWLQLISLAGKEQNYTEMITLSERALDRIPDSPEIYFYQGVAYYQSEEFEKALNSFETAISVYPENSENTYLLSDLYGQLGDINYKLHRTNAAFEAYEKALSYNERNIGVLNNYAYYLSLEKKNLDKAEQMSNTCIRSEPNNSTYLDTYGWVFFVKGDYSLAKFYLKLALQNGGENSGEILEHFGDSLYKGGEVDEAVEYWKKAQEKGQDSATLKQKIATKTYVE